MVRDDLGGCVIAILILLRLLGTGVNGLHATDPIDLTVESAENHLISARIAAIEYGVEPELLLAVAWHESRYREGTVTREPGHRVSCGVMTPEPIARCPRRTNLLQEYQAGARHLRMWIDKYGERGGLTAYAGGGVTVRLCRRGRVISPSGHNACAFAGEMLQRAARIHAAIETTP